MAEIHKLITKLVLDSKGFGIGLKDSKGKLVDFERVTKTVAIGVGALGAAMTASAATMAVITKQTIDQGDKFDKLSQRIGISVEKLSAYEHVANIAGTSLEGMTVGVRRLSKNILDMDRGIGEAKRAFEALNINVRDSNNNLKSSDEVMLEVADRFSQMEDGAEKTGLAMELFGRSGADLIPMFNQGSEGMREMLEEGTKLRGWTTEQAAQSAELQDNITRLTTGIKGYKDEIGKAVIPTLINVTEATIDWFNANEDLKKQLSVTLPEIVRDYLVPALLTPVKIMADIKLASETTFAALNKMFLEFVEIARKPLDIHSKIMETVYGWIPVLGDRIKKLNEKIVNDQKIINEMKDEYNQKVLGSIANHEKFTQELLDLQDKILIGTDKTNKKTLDSTGKTNKEKGQSDKKYYDYVEGLQDAHVVEYIRYQKQLERYYNDRIKKQEEVRRKDVRGEKASRDQIIQWQREYNQKGMAQATSFYEWLAHRRTLDNQEWMTDQEKNVANYQKMWAEVMAITNDASSATSSVVSDILFDSMTNEMKSVEEYWDQWWKSLLRIATDYVSQLAVQAATAASIDLVRDLIGTVLHTGTIESEKDQIALIKKGEIVIPPEHSENIRQMLQTNNTADVFQHIEESVAAKNFIEGMAKQFRSNFIKSGVTEVGGVAGGLKDMFSLSSMMQGVSGPIPMAATVGRGFENMVKEMGYGGWINDKFMNSLILGSTILSSMTLGPWGGAGALLAGPALTRVAGEFIGDWLNLRGPKDFEAALDAYEEAGLSRKAALDRVAYMESLIGSDRGIGEYLPDLPEYQRSLSRSRGRMPAWAMSAGGRFSHKERERYRRAQQRARGGVGVEAGIGGTAAGAAIGTGVGVGAFGGYTAHDGGIITRSGQFIQAMQGDVPFLGKRNEIILSPDKLPSSGNSITNNFYLYGIDRNNARNITRNEIIPEIDFYLTSNGMSKLVNKNKRI